MFTKTWFKYLYIIFWPSGLLLIIFFQWSIFCNQITMVFTLVQAECARGKVHWNGKFTECFKGMFLFFYTRQMDRQTLFFKTVIFSQKSIHQYKKKWVYFLFTKTWFKYLYILFLQAMLFVTTYIFSTIFCIFVTKSQWNIYFSPNLMCKRKRLLRWKIHRML